MSMADHTGLAAELKRWCRGEGLEEAKALLVLVPEEVEIAQIEETLETIKCLGRVRVRGRLFHPSLSCLMVLCECKQSIPKDNAPKEVLDQHSGEKWPIVTLNECAAPDDFAVKLKSLLDTEGRTMEDIQSLFLSFAPPQPSSDPSINSTESVLQAVGDFLEKARKPQAEGGYRRLRLFSGNLPVPPSEDPFDHWLEQAWLMVEESDCTDKEKRRRLMESLKGPALEIAKSVRESDPEAGPVEYLEALESAFGSAESGDDLYFAFRLMQQQPSEKLSDFLRRLERALSKVVQRGGFPASSKDKARLEQLLRGAVVSDLMLINLRLRERKSKPPTFLQLLSEIRTEEEYEASRRKLTTSVQHVQTKPLGTDNTEIQSLKAEVKELKAKLATCMTKSPDVKEKGSSSVQSSEPSDTKELAALKKQVKRLQQKVAQRDTVPDSSLKLATMAAVEANSKTRTPYQNRTPLDEQFCYRCGEKGHFVAKCQNPENQSKVIRKLIQTVKTLKESSGTLTSNAPDTDCHVKQGLLTSPTPAGIPEGLIGPPSIVPLKVNGQPCDALFDSGSQVTIIFESWYKAHLPSTPVHPVTGLNIWGLSESNVSYPYLGYVVVDVEYPAEVTGTKHTVPVLALICPSPKEEQIPVIVGTNTSHVRNLVQECRKEGRDITKSLGIQIHRESLPTFTDSITLGSQDDQVGCVTWQGSNPLSLPPGKDLQITCKVHFQQTVGKEILMFDSSPLAPLPGDVLLQPMVVPANAVQVNSFRILVQNQSARETIIPVGTVMGHLYRTESVISMPSKAPETTAFDSSQIDFGDSPVPEEWKDRLRQKLAERSHVFSVHEWDVGLAKEVEHTIRLADTRPFRQRSRRLAPADIEDVRKHLQELLCAGIIKESRSPYASPIVIVRKKNGTIRMCIDYRLLNSRTVPDQYTTPCIDEALDSLSGSKWFTVLDLRSGYYQIPMAEEDKEKTAFICPLGFFQFERMPQGITGAPATFQRLMEKTVGDMNLLQVLVYLDDLIVFGKSLEEHEERLIKVLDRLGEAGLKISLDKCQFCQPQVKYLGHIVSAQGVSPDPQKIEAVTTWPQPHDLKSLRSFLGFCGYYRRFIANYAAIVRPLTELTKGYAPTQKSKKKSPDINKSYLKESEPFGDRWDDSCSQAFQQIIHCLTHAPVLAFADPTKPYELHVDASFKGLGAVLYQLQEGDLRPVAFASRKLSQAEKRYPIHQLEFLSLKWAVVDRFHDYLYGARFTVRTDNNPLTYVLSTAKLNAVGHRWLAALSTYDFDVHYRPGKHNIDADILSRNFDTDAEWETIPEAAVKSICKRVQVSESPGCPTRCVDQTGASPECIPDIYAFPLTMELQSLEHVSKADLAKAQKEDPVIGPAVKAVQQNLWTGNTPELSLLKREKDKLTLLSDGLLYRITKRHSGEEVHQLVLPKVYHDVVLRSVHNDSGHLGIERTLDLLRRRFYWPRMLQDTEDHIKSCGECITRKTPAQRAAPLHQISSSGPMDLVCIDFLSMEMDSKGMRNVLVVTDHFTRYAQAFPTKNQTSQTVAKTLVDKFFVHYGLPARIHSDQGRDFESRLIKDLLKNMMIRKSRTTPYHPQGDPQPERFNRTLLSMLGTLSTEKKRQWSQHVPYLVHAYNSTKCDATGFSPYFLMFGREARLPVDLCFGTTIDKAEESHSRYVSKLKEDLRQAYKLASETADKVHQKNKKGYDKRVCFQSLEIGDRVLLKNWGLKGKHKLQTRWSPIPYQVVGKMPNLPVYQLKKENGSGRLKTIHRDHILPIGQHVKLPIPEESNNCCDRQKPKGKKPKQATVASDPQLSQDSDSSSESEYYEPQRYYYTQERVREALRQALRSQAVPQEDCARDQDDVSDETDSDQRSEKEELPLEDEDVNRDSETEPNHMVDIQEESDQNEEDDQDSAPEPDLDPRTARSAKTQKPNTHRNLLGDTPKLRPKRQIKPVVRLTYDEPGKAKDQPITIVHRGVVITIGKD